MFDVGFWELAVIGVVALLIVGPERLPGVVRTAGHWVGKARRIAREAKADLEREMKAQDLADLDELKREVQSAGAEFKSAAEGAEQSVGASDIGDSLRETFKEAAPADGENSAAAAENSAPPAADTAAETAGEFYIYENRRAKPHRAVVHAAACAHCNHGRGRAGNGATKNAKWHGPYSSLAAAEQAQCQLTVAVKKSCACVTRHADADSAAAAKPTGRPAAKTTP